ncbi:MAG: flagellar hook-basal body protein, partial [Acetatifactor sp.]|nr:flagellar hook-basal body protein [Acetatifactor sp.]
FRTTDNPYDLALVGEVFFAVEFTYKAGETSTMYTRAGQFTLNREGYLVTEDGDYVLDTQNRRIRLNTLAESQISDDGTISQNGVNVARIQVTDFEDYNYLEKYGETYYRPVEGARTTTASAEVKSGYLEMANVQIVSEMVNLISITRAYESSQKIIQTYDGSLEIAVNQLGKV